ncbi:two-component system, NtrC family, response regulator AtoC [Tindallia californiensis]|uniref:Stage 0 sporulation protein A homolog n=1 Tax=Tindallia californiensis TaxID=159292 RepID=A0A1H3IU26_9FIRM|nr:two-component system, NtrC family, response regulator AtoC [Tindallia californiensis]
MLRKVLIIDDEASICNSLKFYFEDEYQVQTATNIFDVEIILKEQSMDVILLDLKFGDIDGIDLLINIKEIQKESIVIMMTAHGSIQSSIDAMKAGAYDYVMKPLDMDKIRFMVKKAIDYKKLNEKVTFLEKAVLKQYGVHGIIGKSKKMQNVFHLVDKIKDSHINVLIQSDSGTGKEMVAKAIHFQGVRCNNRFEAINCGAIPENLIESELFGHEKGSFTGAEYRKKGRFEIADKGTLFLDEIGEMNLNTQVKLLRVLEEKEVQPIGAEQGKKVDVRIIAATNKDLEKEVAKGCFREDLYFRLNVVTIKIPSLNERKEDIPLLIDHFIKESSDKKIEGITAEALNILESHHYKGNVRELMNIIERAIALTDHHYIQAKDLPEELLRKHKKEWSYTKDSRIIPIKIGTKLKDIEEMVILETLSVMNNNKAKTSKVLGISERNLRYKIKEYQEKKQLFT